MKNRILFIFILTIVGTAIACFITAIKEPLWKAGVEVQIYNSTYLITYPSDEIEKIEQNPLRHLNLNSDFSRLLNLLKSDYLVNRVITVLEKHQPRLANVTLDILKNNQEICMNRKESAIWIYYTCNDPQTSLQIVSCYVNEAIAVISEAVEKITPPMIEIMEAQVSQKKDAITQLQSQLEKLPLGNSPERKLLEKKINDEKGMLAFLMKGYDFEKSRGLPTPMVIHETPRLMSESPINKNYYLSGVIGAISGLLIGLVVSKAFQPRNA